jgi:hypothetical protein
MVDALDHADELLGGNDTLVMNGAAAGRWLLEQPAVQEPVFCEYCGGNDDADFGLPTDHCTDCARPQPAAQPAPVPDATAEEWKDAAWKVWKLARTHNNTIPSHWLDRMRELVIAADPTAQPAVQEPWGYLEIDDIESQREYPHNCRNVNLWHEGGEGMTAIYIAPPTPQPVPVKTYHDGKPWPVQPKPWVGLTDEERNECTQSPFTADHHRAIEAKLKEKNT